MRALDLAKDALTAFLILVANMALLFAVMFVYGTFIDTGHDQAYYEAAAPRLAVWSAPIGGAVLHFLAGLFRIGRNPGRGAMAVVITTWVFYVFIDLAAGFAMAPDASFINLQLAMSLGIALLGGLAATRVATR